jgi:hypothetical protein
MSSNRPEDVNAAPPQAAGEAGRPRFGDLATDALRYWEPRRWIYNGVVLVVVVIHFAAQWDKAKALLAPDGLLRFFMLAVMANIAYCAAYAVDIFVQYSALRPSWTRWRWVILAIGTAFGAVIAHSMMTDFIRVGLR